MPHFMLAALLAMAQVLNTAQAQNIRVPPLREVAPGVYAVIGAAAVASPDNYGMVGNQGVVIGPDGVVLINTGTSARYVSELLSVIKGITNKPVVLAINTHQSPAFVFGNSTLASQGVPILAHREVAELIRQRCHICLKKLQATLGPHEMEGTVVSVPDRVVNESVTIEAAGRQFDILYFGRSSSLGSIAVVDRISGVLFAGGLASIDQVPEAKDADITAWLAALEDLKGRSLNVMVPGEGPVVPVARLDDMASYLSALQSAVNSTYSKGISLGEAARVTQLPEFKHWPLYAERHNNNVEQTYLRREKHALD